MANSAKDSLWQRFSKWFVPLVVYCLVRVWFGSCRIRVHGGEVDREVLGSDKNVVAAFWHYSIIFSMYQLRRHEATVMVSASRDGDYIANLAHRLGYKTARGSKNSRGVGALKQILRDVQEGSTAGLVADGSQGPALKVQPGVILIASRAGVPVVPISVSASRYMRFKSWDKMIVPKPFSVVDFYYGEPLVVPTDLDSEGVEEWRQILEERMRKLYHEGWQVYGKQKH